MTIQTQYNQVLTTAKDDLATYRKEIERHRQIIQKLQELIAA
jgi:hypothetical protein